MKSHVPVPVPNKVWNATFISVLIANMATNLGQFMMNTLIPKYANAMGASATMVGFVSSSFAVTALLLKVFAAPMIDTFNKKYLTFGSVLVIMTAFLGYSVSTNVTMMICFRLLHGAGMAFSTISFLAIAGSALPPDKIGTGIGYFSLGQAAIQAIAPTVGLELAGAIGYNRAFLVGGAIMAASSLLVLNIRGQKSSGRKLRISLKSVVAVESLPAAILLFFLAMAYCTISSFLVIYADTRQVENIGLFFTVNPITLLASRPLVGRLMDKYGFRAVVLPALCCFALAMFVISMATELWMFLVAAFISAFGYGACQPAMQALAIKSVPESRRGSASATNYFGTDLGYLSGPSVAGSIVDSINRGKASPAGYSAMYRCMMIPIGIAAGLLLTVLRKSIARIEQGAAERDKERAAAPAER